MVVWWRNREEFRKGYVERERVIYIKGRGEFYKRQGLLMIVNVVLHLLS